MRRLSNTQSNAVLIPVALLVIRTTLPNRHSSSVQVVWSTQELLENFGQILRVSRLPSYLSFKV
ncbi:unnamed protein product [Hydatigera taeniaeformis]|uniref:Secreted protein n=1 Tax=Hydatigena taeniaeformis TaxID=6205 RepID=A0A0R3WTN0_HYDTA|nr:unnamed protein product [Hydatigera taeniaeformis]